MTFKHVFAGVGTTDYDAALRWYERLFGRSPDVIVKQDEAMWQLADGGWIYVISDTDRAGKAQLTILVDDLEDHLAELANRGIAVPAIATLLNGVRKAVIKDPDGSRSACAFLMRSPHPHGQSRGAENLYRSSNRVRQRLRRAPGASQLPALNGFTE